MMLLGLILASEDRSERLGPVALTLTLFFMLLFLLSPLD